MDDSIADATLKLAMKQTIHGPRMGPIATWWATMFGDEPFSVVVFDRADPLAMMIAERVPQISQAMAESDERFAFALVEIVGAIEIMSAAEMSPEMVGAIADVIRSEKSLIVVFTCGKISVNGLERRQHVLSPGGSA